MKLWKRNAVVGVIVLFVCVAVYLNWSYTKTGAPNVDTGKMLGEAALVDGAGAAVSDPLLGPSGTTLPAVQPQSTYFATARLNRQQARDAALSLLQTAAGDEKATSDAIAQANTAIQAMATSTLSEAQIENLVTAKGYTDCVAFLSDNSMSVVVSGIEGDITATDTAKISEIVMDETGMKASQIKIIGAQ